jgi:orotate phosphoribosyltransferase
LSERFREVFLSGANPQLLRLLRELAYKEGRFTLSSGVESDYYIDAKLATLDPRVIKLVGEAFAEALGRYELDAVGGPELGAVPMITAAAYWSGLPGFIVRREPKKYGLAKWTEGPPLKKGARVAMADDVITSGSSVLKAAERVKAAGCQIVVVMGLVDRLEGGRERIENKGYKYECITTIEEVVAAGKAGAGGAGRDSPSAETTPVT